MNGSVVQWPKAPNSCVAASHLPNNCYKPTVLVNPPLDAEVSQQEVFGPVVCLYSYTDIKEAVAMANGPRCSVSSSCVLRKISIGRFNYMASSMHRR